MESGTRRDAHVAQRRRAGQICCRRAGRRIGGDVSRGPDARNAAIEEGADRPAELLALDYRFSGTRLVDALCEIPTDRLDTPVPWRKPVTAFDLPILRWNEIEIHLMDLDIGYTCHDWPAEFVEFTLASQLGALETAVPGVRVPSLSDAETLAWLVGRPTRVGLPTLPAWPF
ncbi:maleylpyruvate isomerase N-terminal domain-containing protein [Rhodococcus sp. BH4]|uniref:maleylpyruvate isomerase N-terminal domain-containing protein n=1 Tax=Rhodococcus sp. BH4 TaxID=1807790 RepID=UPI001E2C90F6|nr:maleylpyruvate isomerase N-terminal domain-containing protein [Rhodococcus sp. BH4]